MMPERWRTARLMVSPASALVEVNVSAALLRKRLMGMGVNAREVRFARLATPPRLLSPGDAVSVSRSFPSVAGPVTYLFHFACREDGTAVQFEPIEWTVGFADQFSDLVLISGTDDTVLFGNQRLRASAGDLRGQTLPVLSTLAGIDPDGVLALRAEALSGNAVVRSYEVPAFGPIIVRGAPFRYCGLICGVLWSIDDRAAARGNDGQTANAVWHQVGLAYQHQLRNPLQVLLSAVELQRGRTETSPELMEVMERNIRAITEALAEHVHPVADAPAPAQRLSTAAQQAMLQATGWHGTHALRFSHAVPEGEPETRFHTAPMLRVFANLFANSARAKPDAQVAVSYAWDRRVLTCRVADTGPGFPPCMLGVPAIWNTPGRQLGIALVTATVENLGGTVELSNARTGGAVVTMRLPIASEPPAPGSGARRRTRRRRAAGGGSEVAAAR